MEKNSYQLIQCRYTKSKYKDYVKKNPEDKKTKPKKPKNKSIIQKKRKRKFVHKKYMKVLQINELKKCNFSLMMAYVCDI